MKLHDRIRGMLLRHPFREVAVDDQRRWRGATMLYVAAHLAKAIQATTDRPRIGVMLPATMSEKCGPRPSPGCRRTCMALAMAYCYVDGCILISGHLWLRMHIHRMLRLFHCHPSGPPRAANTSCTSFGRATSTTTSGAMSLSLWSSCRSCVRVCVHLSTPLPHMNSNSSNSMQPPAALPASFTTDQATSCWSMAARRWRVPWR